MEIFTLSFIVMIIAVLGMGIGVLSGRSGLKGSCGGLTTLRRLGLDCSMCPEPRGTEERAVCQSRRHQSETSGACRPGPSTQG